jgi:hypothetical protein
VARKLTGGEIVGVKKDDLPPTKRKRRQELNSTENGKL